MMIRAHTFGAPKESEVVSKGLAEVHAQVGLNIAPNPKNCAFCAVAVTNEVFREKAEISIEEAELKVFRELSRFFGE